MSHSEQINELAAALAKAQGEMDPAIFDKINPHFKSKYASYVAVREATRKQLSKYGLALTEITETDGNGSFVLHTFLIHSSGQWFCSDHPLPSGAQPQALASARTYARRGSLQGIVGIAGDDDDDGNEAQKAPLAKPSVMLQAQEGTRAGVREGMAKVYEQQTPLDAGEPREVPLPEQVDAEGWVRFGQQMIAAASKDWPDWEECNQINLKRMENEAPRVHARMVAAIKKAQNA